jgi:hypothetical protein
MRLDGRVKPGHDGGGRWVIFFETWYYLVLPDGIEIVRVLHCARDLGAIFLAGNLSRFPEAVVT